MICLLTSHPKSAACQDLLSRAGRLGIPMRLVGRMSDVVGLAGLPSPVVREQDIVFAYGASRVLLRKMEGMKALVINGVAYSKHMQYERLRAAGIPVPAWRRVQGKVRVESFSGLQAPFILKPDFGGFGIGVRLVAGPEEVVGLDLGRAHIVQEFLPCHGRCARVVVLGSKVASAIDRVAHDGVVAAYRGGKAGRLEAITLDAHERELCVAAAEALGVEIAGVDLIRTERGPFILEVNHRFVPFHMRAMYGDVMDHIVLYLAARQSMRSSVDAPPTVAWNLPRARNWRVAVPASMRIDNCMDAKATRAHVSTFRVPKTPPGVHS